MKKILLSLSLFGLLSGLGFWFVGCGIPQVGAPPIQGEGESVGEQSMEETSGMDGASGDVVADTAHVLDESTTSSCKGRNCKCSNSSQCEEWLVCVKKDAKDAEGVCGDCAKNEECATPGMPSRQCVNNTCRRACKNREDCRREATQICNAGLCMDTCSGDAECSLDERCVSRMCSKKVCKVDGECILVGFICHDATCQPGCRFDEQCGSKRYCDKQKVSCEQLPPQCGAKEDCPSGFTCTENRCMRHDCDIDAHCGKNRLCVSNTCMDTCVSNDNCKRGLLCQAGRCVVGCTKTSECPFDYMCDQASKQCVRAPCVINADCPEGHVCDRNLCRIPPEPPAQEATPDAGQPDSLSTDNLQSGECGRDEQCVGNQKRKFCDKNTNTCVECFRAEHCVGQVGKPHCNLGQKVCVACVVHSDCGQASLCINDVCVANHGPEPTMPDASTPEAGPEPTMPDNATHDHGTGTEPTMADTATPDRCVPTAESCNGKDDDCDGMVDNGFNVGATCTVGVGECVRSGVFQCKADGSGTVCSATAAAPTTEICNGKDDDCDGRVDGFTKTCTTACGSATQLCTNGVWSACTAPQPTAESCNGKDDDCDGMVDNGFNVGATCSVGVGECVRTGFLQCKADGSGTVCSAIAAAPTTEICNGKDDDCDGRVDGFTKTCTTACGSATQLCTNGVWSACTAPQPTAEVCNGKDDDCDGMVDNGFNVGATCSVGVGECVRSGVFQCKADGSGTVCSASAASPTTEICNGKDDDCDGRVDGFTKTCTTACGSATQLCTNGVWSACTAPQPTAESCNGKDDDCDGMVDNNPNDADLGTDCYTGTSGCTLANGIFTCKGVCKTGRLTCQGGQKVCLGQVLPTAEVIDGLDNNCDGQVDEDRNIRLLCIGTTRRITYWGPTGKVTLPVNANGLYVLDPRFDYFGNTEANVPAPELTTCPEHFKLSEAAFRASGKEGCIILNPDQACYWVTTDPNSKYFTTVPPACSVGNTPTCCVTPPSPNAQTIAFSHKDTLARRGNVCMTP